MYVSLASDPGPNCSSNTALEHPEVKKSVWPTMKALTLQNVIVQWSFRLIANLLITVNQSLLSPCWPKHLRRQKTSCSSWHLQVIRHGDSSAWTNNFTTDAEKCTSFLYRLNCFLISEYLRVLEIKGKLAKVKKIHYQLFIWKSDRSPVIFISSGRWFPFPDDTVFYKAILLGWWQRANVPQRAEPWGPLFPERLLYLQTDLLICLRCFWISGHIWHIAKTGTQF